MADHPEGTHLNDMVFEVEHEKDGRRVVRLNGELCGNQSPSREGAQAYGQRQEAELQNDEESERLYQAVLDQDPDFPVVLEKMRELAYSGKVDPEDVRQIENYHRRFLPEYFSLKKRMVASEGDNPRVNELEYAREMLREHDEQFGPRSTAQRDRIERRIASLMLAGGR